LQKGDLYDTITIKDSDCVSYNIDDIKEHLKGTEYEILIYNGSKKQNTFNHKVCSGTFKRSWATFKKGLERGKLTCPCCGHNVIDKKWKTKQLTIEEIGEKLKGTGFSVVSYSGYNKTKSIFKHVKCGAKFERRVDCMFRGTKNKGGITCPACNIRGKWKTHTQQDVVDMLKGSKYEIVGEYIDVHTLTEFRHLTCGNTFYATLSNVLKNVREYIDSCAYCYSGESSKAKFAKALCGETFKDSVCEWNVCRSPKTNAYLPFDIYIADANTVIEIMGQQHYRFSKLFHKDKKGFEYLKWKDSYKKQWCDKNGINYISIDIRKNNEEDIKSLICNLKTVND